MTALHQRVRSFYAARAYELTPDERALLVDTVKLIERIDPVTEAGHRFWEEAPTDLPRLCEHVEELLAQYSTGGKLNGPEIIEMLVAVQACVISLMVNEYTETCDHLP